MFYLVVATTVLAETLPPKTTVPVFYLPINIVYLLWVLDGLWTTALLFSIANTRLRRGFHGGIMSAILDVTERVENLFAVMAPLVCIWTVVFVSIAIKYPFLWNNFTSFYISGVFVIYFAFT